MTVSACLPLQLTFARKAAIAELTILIILIDFNGGRLCRDQKISILINICCLRKLNIYAKWGIEHK